MKKGKSYIIIFSITVTFAFLYLFNYNLTAERKEKEYYKELELDKVENIYEFVIVLIDKELIKHLIRLIEVKSLSYAFLFKEERE